MRGRRERGEENVNGDGKEVGGKLQYEGISRRELVGEIKICVGESDDRLWNSETKKM